MNLNEIKKMPIHGNYHQDEPIFQALDRIVQDPTQPMQERLGALGWMSTIMGENPGDPTIADLADYLSELEMESRVIP